MEITDLLDFYVGILHEKHFVAKYSIKNPIKMLRFDADDSGKVSEITLKVVGHLESVENNALVVKSEFRDAVFVISEIYETEDSTTIVASIFN